MLDFQIMEEIRRLVFCSTKLPPYFLYFCMVIRCTTQQMRISGNWCKCLSTAHRQPKPRYCHIVQQIKAGPIRRAASKPKNLLERGHRTQYLHERRIHLTLKLQELNTKYNHLFLSFRNPRLPETKTIIIEIYSIGCTKSVRNFDNYWRIGAIDMRSMPRFPYTVLTSSCEFATPPYSATKATFARSPSRRNTLWNSLQHISIFICEFAIIMQRDELISVQKCRPLKTKWINVRQNKQTSCVTVW
jgi:hypothetical protein